MLPVLSSHFLWIALLVFARSIGILRLLPVLGGAAVSRTIRSAEGILLTLCLFPALWHHSVNIPETPLEKLLVLLSEYLIGMAAGALPAILFSALSLAGELIGRIGGFSAAATLDPEWGEENGGAAVLLKLTGTAVFLAAGGLEKLVLALITLFDKFPPGTPFQAESILTAVSHLLSQAAVLGIQLALPLLVSMVSLWIAAGILNRVIPHLQFLTMTMTFSGNLLATLAILHLTLGSMILFFISRLPDWSRLFPTLFTP